MVAAQTTNAPGKAGLIVTAGALTVLALIGGGLVGKLTVQRLRGAVAPTAAAANGEGKPYPPTVEVRELPAIVTNLAAPAASRVRLQVAVVFSKAAMPDAGAIAAQLTDDIVAFLKTLSLPELQGASGLQNLREDLNERAAIRAQGKVREVVIEGLVVE